MSMQDSQQISEVKVMLLKGEGGRGIASIVKTGISGALGDVYTITYTDGTKTTYTVENGNGITSIAKTGTSGALTDVYTITFDDGSTETFNVTNGNGITSIAKTGTSGNVDTYTITMTDGTEYTFTVTNAEQAGHTIKDEGFPMTDRAALDFVDFDLTDDSVNDETKITPHRFSAAEMTEICSPLPDAPTVVGNVRMSLLWTNPSPSASFAAQNILENVADYDFVFICAGITTNLINIYCKYGSKSTAFINSYSGNNLVFQRRTFEFRNHVVSCVKGQSQTQGSAITDDNTVLIPQYIYGIKLV